MSAHSIPPEPSAPSREELTLRSHGPPAAPALVYLPGLHGDWTLVGGFREAVAGAVWFSEFTYPRSRTWSLDDYASAVDTALGQADVRQGWLLAESFGSQVAWALIGLAGRCFEVEGMILAGGFVRHPMPRVVGICARMLDRVSVRSLRRSLRGYTWYARVRRGTSPSRRAELDEFVARRTEPDLKAAVHRLRLIETADFRPVAAATRLPVYYLTGFVDPVVPWVPVKRWLRRHCPGYQGWRLVWGSDHNVLSSVAPAANQTLAWMRIQK